MPGLNVRTLCEFLCAIISYVVFQLSVSKTQSITRLEDRLGMNK